MSVPDLNAFCQTLVRSKLLTEAEVSELRKQAHAAAADGFAGWLVERGKLTSYQADSLLRGNLRFFLDDYKLLDRIGQGRMAGVYRAVHALGMPVAIKVLPPSKAKQADCLARFQREADLALHLDHPHVVRTYHAGTCDGLHYIAMEDKGVRPRGKVNQSEFGSGSDPSPSGSELLDSVVVQPAQPDSLPDTRSVPAVKGQSTLIAGCRRPLDPSATFLPGKASQMGQKPPTDALAPHIGIDVKVVQPDAGPGKEGQEGEVV